ncbi:MAG TPA: hypothetical protein VFZ12_01945, partial [Dehalococcoidia bacterium]|nr:hypothetical protein [Dehalococcoidia bacterium]
MTFRPFEGNKNPLPWLQKADASESDEQQSASNLHASVSARASDGDVVATEVIDHDPEDERRQVAVSAREAADENVENDRVEAAELTPPTPTEAINGENGAAAAAAAAAA